MEKSTYPLHPAQLDVYIDQFINSESPHYNIGGYIKLKGNLNKEKFQEAINSSPEVFDAFKLRFDLNGQDPLCYFDQNYERLEMADLDFSDRINPKEEAACWMQNRFNSPFSIQKVSLLFEQYLIKIAADEYWFFGRYHHLITDGYGFITWVQYIARKYNSLLAGDNAEFKYPPYLEEAVKASEYYNSAHYESDGRYWKEKISAKPQKFLQRKYQHLDSSDRKSTSYVVNVTKDQRKLIEEIQVITKSGLQQLTIAALLIYFGKTSDHQSEFIFGVPVHKRGSKRLRNIVGMFSGILPYKGIYQKDIKLIDLLRNISHSQKSDYRHQNYLIGDLSRDLKINSSEDHLFEIIVNYEPLNFELVFGREIEASIFQLTNEYERNPLQLCWRDFGGQQSLELHVDFQYQYFSQAEIELLCRRIIFILEQFPVNLDKQVGDINIIPDGERYQLQVGFNSNKAEFPEDKTIVNLLEEQVSKTPNNIAVVFEETELTYKELDERSNQLAHYLRSKGVKEEVLVPICIERSLGMIIGLLGIMKAGGAYVPIDPEYPQERTSFMLEDTGASIIVSSGSAKSKLSVSEDITIIELDVDWVRISKEPISPIHTSPESEHLAYMIYTSGSTGKPKGVMIEHRSLMNFIFGLNKVLPLDENDHLLAITSISFDISILELFWTLCRGIKVTIKGDGKSMKGLSGHSKNSSGSIQMDFSLFYFSSQVDIYKNKYDFLLRSVKFADSNNFSGIWLPERHFHEFGGIFPNPAVLGAGLATLTRHIEIRAGSVVLPLNDVIRVAEEWSVVDNLSNGRISLSIASGWHADDFVLMPENYAQRHEIMFRQIDELKALWRGSGIRRMNGFNKEIEVTIFPRPLQAELPIWITSAGNSETFKGAGKIGAKILTHLLGQKIEDLENNIIIYKQSLRENGYSLKNAKVALMLHTYVGTDLDKVKSEVKEPFKSYLRSNISLIKNLAKSLNIENFEDGDLNEILEIAFERYWQTSALLGTNESCRPLIEKLYSIGVTEIACLIDFGVEDEKVFESLNYLNDLRKTFNQPIVDSIVPNKSISSLQITPSYLSALIEDTESQLFLKSLKHLIIGGEKLPEEIVRKLSVSTDAAIYNMYGPTETTIWSTSKTVDIKSKITIGRPIQNTNVYILDEEKNLCPIGVLGELFIGGDGLARGYYKNTELTEERFIPNPFTYNSSDRIYKTGDLAKWLPNGDIEIAGRNDDQIKLSGYRIEPDEIEYVMNQSAGVIKSVVTVKEDVNGKTLVGYVQVNSKFSKAELFAYLKSKLPRFMVPSVIMELEEFPLTSNGKINRKALPAPDASEQLSNQYVAPRNVIEKVLANILGDLLGVTQVGIYDNFFGLGLHSLLALRLVSATRRKLEVELAVKELFVHPTIAELAGHLEGLSKGLSLSAIKSQLRPERIPLSFGQERLWFIDQLQGSVQYHLPAVFVLKGLLKKDALENTLQTIITRHEVLRTVIREVEGQAYQYIKNKDEWRLRLIDGYQFQQDPQSLQQYIKTITSSPFDLSKDHMLRASLIALNEHEHVLVLTFHHIASDAWSTSLFVKEVVELYKSYDEGRPIGLEPLEIQYADFAIWQRQYLQGELLDRKLSYWKHKLQGVTPLQLPGDYVRPAIQSTKGVNVGFEIDKELSADLQILSQQQGTTLFMTLLAAFKVLLHRYSGQQDICVGTSIAGRQHEEVEALMGFFSNTLALRTEVSGDALFTGLLQQVRTTTLEAYEHQEVPFEKVVEAVVKERDMSRSPLFQVMFVLQNTPEIPQLRFGQVQLSQEAFSHNTSKFDLTLFITETTYGLRGSVEYSPDVYSEQTISRMMTHYKQLLSSIVAKPDQRIGILPMLTPSEEHRLVVELNATMVSYPRDRTIVDIFEEQVLKTPGNIALVFEGEGVSYLELNQRANRLAHYLRGKGVREETLVPIYIERSIGMMVGILGILKSGGAYVPLDTDFPPDRLSYMLGDTGARIVVSSKASSSRLPDSLGIEVIEMDDESSVLGLAPSVNLPTHVGSDHLAYVIYTSGSTGRPKGVMIEHRSLVDYVFGLKQALQIDQCRSFALVSTIATDLGNTVIYSSLLVGGSLHLFSKETVSNVDVLQRYFEDQGIDCLKIVPSHWRALSMGGRLLLPVKLLIFGGESLQAELVEEIRLSASGCRIVNHYGPTETTIGKLLHVVKADIRYRHTIPVGRPFSNTQVYVLSKDLSLCAPGIGGQLYIGGDGVSRGYVNNAGLTGEKFINNPFDPSGSGVMYATGDLVKYLPDGNIVFLGRVDDQVKIRGYRVELGEIESVLLGSGLVSQAVVLARSDKEGKGRLVGYIVAADGVFDKEAIGSYVRDKLPEYMVPAVWVEVEGMPLTANGKVDKKALPDPDAGEVLRDRYVAPGNAVETTLAGIWKEVLEVEQVGIHDDFFELGGHSLLAVRLISLMRKELSVEMPISDIFDYPTIALLSGQLESQSGRTILPSIKAEARPEHIPLSFSQERLWFIDQLEGSVQYHVPGVLGLKGRVNPAALQYALGTIVNRHEVLRTVILQKEGQPFQSIKDKDGWRLDLVGGYEFVQNPAALQQYIEALINAPFDLSGDHMLRGHLITLTEDKHVLVVTLHHIASDAWSRSVLVKEVVELYGSYEASRPPRLSPLSIQYADYAMWQRKYLEGDLLDRKLGYWKQKLQGVAPLQLPTDYSRPAVQSTQGASKGFLINKELLSALQILSQQQGATLFMTLLAAFKVLLYRYSGQQDICVGSPIAGRQQQEVEDLIGFFVNTLALRSEVRGDASFSGLLNQLKATTLEAYEHQEVPFEKVVDAVVRERDMSRNPLFQVMFVWQNTPEVPELRLGELILSREEYEQTTSKFDLILFITETLSGLSGSVEYSTDLYSEPTIVRMIGHFEELLTSIVKQPDQRIGELPMLGQGEKDQLLEEFNNTGVEYSVGESISGLFEEQVEKTPDQVAVVLEERELTYKELNERSNQLARYLKTKGVKEDTLVPICIERSAEMIVGILGILKAGGAYVPIDPDYPSERIDYMVEDSRAILIVSSKRSRSKLPGASSLDIIELDGDRPLINGELVDNLGTGIKPHHLAYVLYTSGSTGKPKGVKMSGGSLVNLLRWQQKQFENTSRRVLQFASLNFDVSFQEIFSTLCFGSGLYLIDGERRKDMSEVLKDLGRYSITHLFIPYIVLKNLSEYIGSISKASLCLQEVIVAGEQLKFTEDIQDFIIRYSINLINQYGPTEAHVVSSYRVNSKVMYPLPPIGKPVDNTQIYISRSNQLSPIGVSGEICIGGVQVAAGYLNRGDLTAEKFIANPFSKEPGARIYKTGDLGRWLPDGNIEYLGRMDDQVKIRGYRVELGEIESMLQECRYVNKAVVLAREYKGGSKQLVGYVVSEGSFDPVGIVSFLKSKLPEYMVPALWVDLESLPLSPNGKIDRKVLPDPADAGESLDVHYTAPRNKEEGLIAEIWQKLLQVERAGIHDNFFELGGHSLLATRVISSIRNQLEVELAIKDLFLHPTIAELASHLREQSKGLILPAIKAAPRPELVPLSFSQERLWFIDQLRGTEQYHLSSMFRLRGRLNKEALEYAFHTIIARHEVLRTVVREKEGQAWQYIKDKSGQQLNIIDGYQYKQDAQSLQNHINRLIRKPFDLSKDDMLRADLIILDLHEHMLVVTMHHIASDGWSLSIIVKELVELYGAYVENRPVQLSPLEIQYADYAIWQQKYLQGELLNKKIEYWKKKLEGVNPLQLPTDYARPSVQSHNGAVYRFNIDKELSEQLLLLSRQENTTLFMTLLAVFKVLLYKYSSQQDICVGTSSAGRQQQEVEGLIGFFVNTLVLRTELSGDASFTETLQQVKATTLEGYEHQEVPFEKVVDAVVKQRDMSRNPLAQVMFVLQNTPEVPEIRLEELIFSNEDYEHTTAQFDLTLFLTETVNGLQGTMEYSTDLYSELTIKRVVSHFKELLNSVVTGPKQSIGLLPMLTEAEKHQLLFEFNDTKVEYPREKTLIELFEEQVLTTPNAVAVVFQEDQLSYQQLNERSNQLAHYLLEKGIQPGTNVALLSLRGLEMIIGMLGILKAGCAYVPLNTEYPAERLNFIIEDSAITHIVFTDTILLNQYGLEEYRSLINVKDSWYSSTQSTGIKSRIDSCAYIMYTSGTTGRPKGIAVNHGNIIKLVYDSGEISVKREDRMLQWSNYSFDGSVYEIYCSLLLGASLHLIREGYAANITELSRVIKEQKITVCFITTALFNTFIDINTEVLKGLRKILFGGEMVSFFHVRKALSILGSGKIIHVYGPTETTVYATYYPIENVSDTGVIPIGKPLSNTKVLILDSNEKLVPVGVAGELYIGGDGLSRGYLNRAELTLEKFIQDPFSKAGQTRLYRSGDIGRWLPDGNIEYLGRKDDQVKIRGYRIELGEIESVLLQSELVSQAVVLGREDKEGTRRLVCYVVSEGKLDREAITSYLKVRLPEYMVPVLWVELESMPLTPNGKVDRKSLPDPDVSAVLSNEYVGARNEVESKLAEIWQELLCVERVGIHDNFFEIGGDSLLAIRLISAIRRELVVEMAISKIFEYSTIALLSEQLESQSGRAVLASIKAEGRPEHVPLSFSQERLWFIDRLGGSVQYHIPAVLRLKGNLNKDALIYSLRDMVNRHEVLRTVILEQEGEAYQHIKDKDGWELGMVDGHVYQQATGSLHEYVQQLINKPFDLSSDYMLRGHLITVDDQDHVLVITMHHIASDGWSRSVLVKEVIELYESYEENRPARLAPLEIQYADYSIWQRKHLQGELLDRKLGYWKEQLQGVPPLQLPTDYGRPGVRSTRGAIAVFSVDKELSEQLQLMSQQAEATLFMTLLAAFKVLLYRYSGQGDICVGTSVAGRQQQETESLIGFFINTLALRSHVDGELSFRDLLQQIRTTTLEAYEHQEVPFEKVVDAVVMERDMSRNPLFQVLFVLQNTPEIPRLRLGEMQLSAKVYEHTTAQFDLNCSITETAVGLQGSLEYSTDLYREQTITRMLGHFKELLSSIVKEPEQKIGKLPMLTQAEEHQLLREFNDTLVEYKNDKTVIDLFEEQAGKTPDTIALIFEEDQLRYEELNQRANQLAHYLRSRGVREETLVPICMEPGIEMVVGILGILKSGGAYVPVDPDYPLDRIRYMLEDSGAAIVVSSTASITKLPDSGDIDIITLDDQSTGLSQQPSGNLNTHPGSHHLAYVIYTSGSTGTPKGVMIEHRSLINYLLNSKARYIRDERDGVGSFIHLSYTFDASLTAMLMPLLWGKSIVVGSKGSVDVFEDPNFARYAPYDFIKITPSHLELLQAKIQAGDGRYLTRRLVVGGEALQPGHFNYFIDKGLDVEIINEYGPTEATVGCSTYRFYTLDDSEKRKYGIPIGKPIDNIQIYILNEQSELLPVGVVGELCIGGAGVARGYFNGGALTSEKFIVNRFHEEAGARMYRTGDLGRWLPDGNMEYLGRKDEQVKIRGYRIELGEIEIVLGQSELVRESVVVARENKEGTRQLVGYVVAKGMFDKEAIVSYLKSRLPEYMVPSVWVELESLPLTPHGKIDRKALPDGDASELLSNEYVAPRNELEVKLAEIWQELLGAEAVGIHDNFFELGGDSIIIIQVVSRARRSGYELQVADIFTHQTIARLSVVVNQRSDTLFNEHAEQSQLTGSSGLLPIQQWYFEGGQEVISHYNQSVILGIAKSVTELKLREAVEQLAVHHDALRFEYHKTQQGDWQQVYGDNKAAVITEDLRSVPEDLLSTLITACSDRHQRSLDIEKGELVRVVWMRTPEEEGENRLLMVIHHLAIDGVSWRILLEDLEILLSAPSDGQGTTNLGPKSSSYRQWYESLQRYGQSNRLRSQKNYWQKLLGNHDPFGMGNGHGERLRLRDMGKHTVRLEALETQRLLQEVPRAYHTEINDILLCALARTLCGWRGMDKVVIGLEGHGREEGIAEGMDLSRTVGWFTSLYPVLLEGSIRKTEDDLIKSVKEQLRQVPDKGMGYGVLKYINKEQSFQGKDSWDIVFNYLGQSDNVIRESRWLSGAVESAGASRSEEYVVSEKLSVTGMVQAGQLVLNWSYSSHHYEEQTIRKLAADYITNLEALIVYCTEQQRTGAVYTPSDYGLGSEITFEELDSFLNERV